MSKEEFVEKDIILQRYEQLDSLVPCDSPLIRCDICGIVAPVCNMNKMNITSYENCGTTVRTPESYFNICQKCLPKLMTAIQEGIRKVRNTVEAEYYWKYASIDENGASERVTGGLYLK